MKKYAVIVTVFDTWQVEKAGLTQEEAIAKRNSLFARYPHNDTFRVVTDEDAFRLSNTDAASHPIEPLFKESYTLLDINQ